MSEANEVDGVVMCEPVNGKFYWVKTAFDPDTNEKWVNEIQPAVFTEGKWVLLGTEDEWPVIWVGTEITHNYA